MDHATQPRVRGLIPTFAKGAKSLRDIDTHPLPTPRDKYYADQRARFASLVDDALRSTHASPQDAAAVRAAVGIGKTARPPRLLLSHLPLRAAAAERLYAQLQGPFEGGPAERSWHFITLITDVGNSLEYAPVVELGRLKSLSGKLLRRLDLCGIGFVELQLADYPRGRGGRTISAHTHMVAYSDNPNFNARAAERLINRGATGSNWLGARACRIQPIPNWAALRDRCLYMLKSPLQGSYLQPDARQPTGFRSRPREVDALGALRLAELLSKIELRTAAFARGLTVMKGDWIRDVATWLRRVPSGAEHDYAEAFAGVWAGSAIWYPRIAPIIRLNAKQEVDDRWRLALSDLVGTVAENRCTYAERAGARRLPLGRPVSAGDDL